VRATDVCRAERPPLTPLCGGHEVRCYHPIVETTAA